MPEIQVGQKVTVVPAPEGGTGVFVWQQQLPGPITGTVVQTVSAKMVDVEFASWPYEQSPWGEEEETLQGEDALIFLATIWTLPIKQLVLS